ncbi:MAG: TRL-like family protein [Leptospiraceae bacterium]|nr:TRL-like family protein [Leptospiraceae bacterium]
MRKIIVLLLLMNLSSCITTISPGIIFNNTAEHVYRDRTTSQLGSGRIIKMEKSCTYNSIVFAFFYHGKVASAASVAREGGITKIGVVDYSSFNILGPLFYSNCIIVWGDIE